MDDEDPGIEPRPEIRGPLVELLTLMYGQLTDDEIAGYDAVSLPGEWWAHLILDLGRLWILYAGTRVSQEAGDEQAVSEITERAIWQMAEALARFAAENEKTKGDFRAFLQGKGKEAYGLVDDDPE
jgi:hypothetical protein